MESSHRCECFVEKKIWRVEKFLVEQDRKEEDDNIVIREEWAT